MPIYEYQCDECGHIFDALQKMSDELLTDCPDCGQGGAAQAAFGAKFPPQGRGLVRDRLQGQGQAQPCRRRRQRRRQGRGQRCKDKAKGADKGGEKGADKTKSEKKTPDSKKSDGGGKPAGGSSD